MSVPRNPEAYMTSFRRVIDSSVATAALVDPTPSATKPIVIDTAANSVMECMGWSQARIMFGGSDAANETFNYQVILWSKVSSAENTDTWVPRVISAGLVTLGTDVYAAAGLGAITNFFADTITETIHSGSRVFQPENLRAVLEIPLLNAERLEIQTDLPASAPAATADAFVQLCNMDPPRLAIDQSSGAQSTVEYDHHEIHAGSSFHVGYSVTTANSDDDVTGIMFTTPNTKKWGHLTATFTASGAAEAIINEAPTLSTATAGSDKVILNRNRNSSTVSAMKSLEGTPTVGSVTKMNETEWTNIGVTAGTELEHVFLAAGSGSKTIGGTARGTQEWILKQNTTYIFYLQNTGASANKHSISLDWYEHTDR